MILRVRVEHTLTEALNGAEAFEEAARRLRAGELIAFPTDTVYGLAADPLQPRALSALFAAKGRPDNKPIPLLVGNADGVERVTTEVSPLARRLMARFWPGPLTLILPAAASLPAELLGGGATVGVRMPDHPVALGVLRAFGGPLAVTSANRSGERDSVDADMVEAALSQRFTLLLDSGRVFGGVASTVVDLTGAAPRILRVGPLSHEALASAWEENSA